MIQRENVVIGYRATDQEMAILNRKVALSGLTRSEFLRRLVEQAEVEPVKIGFRQRKNRHDANDLTGQHVTAVGA